ncbi:AI-2E family transporter [Galbibacter pacificus]|uniref:AI-2E family transporter n=1 Tax=Galbibacter pacificus TaxID=2996052 RepID=A0ABT6FMV2_9FLAO|nr:AI-2E family transporter [Galbibacter pacificus]MDG3580943.1 AI-2E family transporter [Galbibacter pacificus]MDG3584421.1 AI-2E family transporter [Galbibacter pacificus]
MNKERLSPALTRQLFMLITIIVLGYLIAKEMVPYLSGILGAITIYVIFKKFMIKLVNKGFKQWISAAIVIVLSMFIIVIPISLIILLLSSKIQKAASNSEELTTIVKSKLDQIEGYIGIDFLSQINTKDITSWVSDQIQGLVGSTFDTVIAVTIMYFILYFMLINAKKLQAIFLEYIPLSDKNIAVISKESSDIVKSNAIGIPLVAFMQGIVALIGYYIFGVKDPLFWFVVTVVGSMIPFIGTALGIVPVTILLLSQGENWQAIGLLIYGIAVVGSTDNVFRVIVQNRLANLHPLITLIGVIIGVPLFGFIGLIFGPLLLSLFLLLVKIYKNEYGSS